MLFTTRWKAVKSNDNLYHHRCLPVKAVIPAKAGIQNCTKHWIPVCMGMTNKDQMMRSYDFEVGSSDE
jgi:hypothetical protein